MKSEIIQDPAAFFASRGGLHDTEILRVDFRSDESRVALSLNDLNANFDGLPEYPGPRPCELLLQGVATFLLDAETAEGVRIADAAIVRVHPLFRLEIDFNLGGGSTTRGRRSIVAEFESLHIIDR